jgi:hypothetical protein
VTEKPTRPIVQFMRTERVLLSLAALVAATLVSVGCGGGNDESRGVAIAPQ